MGESDEEGSAQVSPSMPGATNPNWKGGRWVGSQGYVIIWTPEGYKREHMVIAEKALGRPLPKFADVHHVDGDRANNDPRNLVICEDRGFHFHLHYRTRALDACGNANWKYCKYCKTWDAPENIVAEGGKRANTYWHRACHNKKMKMYYRRKKHALR